MRVPIKHKDTENIALLTLEKCLALFNDPEINIEKTLAYFQQQLNHDKVRLEQRLCEIADTKECIPLLFHAPLPLISYLLKQIPSLVTLKTEIGKNLLFHAALKGDVDLFNYLNKDYSLLQNQKTKNGLTVYHYLCMHQNMLPVLTSLTGSVEFESWYPSCEEDSLTVSPACYAAESGCYRTVQWLYNLAGDAINIDMKNNIGWTPFLRAAAKGHLDVVKYLLEECEGSRARLAQKYNGANALIIAADSGRLKIVQYLLENFAERFNIDEPADDEYGSDALYDAITFGHVEVAKHLIANGANGIDNIDKTGWTSFLRAAANGHLHAVKYLLEECEGFQARLAQKNNGANALIKAAACGHLKVVQYLLENFGGIFNINEPADNCVGNDALSDAIAMGHVEVAKFLTAKGATGIDNKNKTGWTPFLRAADNGHLDAVKYLLQECEGSRARLAQTQSGENALVKAARHGRVKVVKFFIDNGTYEYVDRRSLPDPNGYLYHGCYLVPGVIPDEIRANPYLYCFVHLMSASGLSLDIAKILFNHITMQASGIWPMYYYTISSGLGGISNEKGLDVIHFMLGLAGDELGGAFFEPYVKSELSGKYNTRHVSLLCRLIGKKDESLSKSKKLVEVFTLLIGPLIDEPRCYEAFMKNGYSPKDLFGVIDNVIFCDTLKEHKPSAYKAFLTFLLKNIHLLNLNEEQKKVLLARVNNHNVTVTVETLKAVCANNSKLGGWLLHNKIVEPINYDAVFSLLKENKLQMNRGLWPLLKRLAGAHLVGVLNPFSWYVCEEVKPSMSSFCDLLEGDAQAIDAVAYQKGMVRVLRTKNIQGNHLSAFFNARQFLFLGGRRSVYILIALVKLLRSKNIQGKKDDLEAMISKLRETIAERLKDILISIWKPVYFNEANDLLQLNPNLDKEDIVFYLQAFEAALLNSKGYSPHEATHIHRSAHELVSLISHSPIKPNFLENLKTLTTLINDITKAAKERLLLQQAEPESKQAKQKKRKRKSSALSSADTDGARESKQGAGSECFGSEGSGSGSGSGSGQAESKEYLSTSQIRSAAKTVRGKQSTRNNCVPLAQAMIHYFMTGEARPASPKSSREDFIALIEVATSADQPSVKQEPGMKSFVARSSARLTGTQMEQLPPPQYHPQAGGVCDTTKAPIIDMTVKDALQTKVHVTRLTNALKQIASRQTSGVSYGLVNLAQINEKVFEAGHQFVYYATKDQVIYCDPSFVVKEKGDPIINLIKTDEHHTGFYFHAINDSKKQRDDVVFSPYVFFIEAYQPVSHHKADTVKKESLDVEMRDAAGAGSGSGSSSVQPGLFSPRAASKGHASASLQTQGVGSKRARGSTAARPEPNGAPTAKRSRAVPS